MGGSVNCAHRITALQTLHASTKRLPAIRRVKKLKVRLKLKFYGEKNLTFKKSAVMFE